MGGKVPEHKLQKVSKLMDDIAESPALKKMQAGSDVKKPTSPISGPMKKTASM